ncbi:MAG: hypothetical protein BWY89_01439 [Bacteroidetes bacterium ADurb.BinA012]|nr:MAG: hypothetical protein BWY89_01439 [Bacteroidetes bacterium ADurb.BinA012]
MENHSAKAVVALRLFMYSFMIAVAMRGEAAPLLIAAGLLRLSWLTSSTPSIVTADCFTK